MKKISRRALGMLSMQVGVSVLVAGTELRILRRAQSCQVDASPLAIDGTAIDGTATWNAAAAKEPIQVLNHKPIGIVIHHTTNANTNDFSHPHAWQLARQIQQSHFSRGWIDTGQHFTVSRGGWIMEGRHKSLSALQGGTTHVEGAHVEGHNKTHVGIECEGLYMNETPSLPLWNKLVALCGYICSQYSLTASDIVGHRDLGNTSCPGDTMYSLLPQLRAAVNTTLHGGVIGRTWPILRRNTHATGLAKTMQYLLRSHGATIVADGAFGSATEAAVKHFQSTHALTADGVVGALVWEKLIVTLRLGDTGDAVKALQNQLTVQKYPTAINGDYVASVVNLVRAFQTNRQITADGVVGINSWNNLAM
jgi:hypothetical protein